MNKMKLEFDARLENEVFARCAGVAFCMSFNPTVDEVMEIKTILAEAITNAIIHGYPQNKEGIVSLSMTLQEDGTLTIIVEDKGEGIEDIKLAMQPMMTSRPDLERSGMGMTIMDSFSDHFEVESKKGLGTRVTLIKKLGNHE